MLAGKVSITLVLATCQIRLPNQAFENTFLRLSPLVDGPDGA